MRRPVPFPVRPKASAPWHAMSNEAVHDAIRSAPIRHVPVDKIVSYQRSVKAERVLNYVRDPSLLPELGPLHTRTGTPVEVPIVFHKRGRMHAYDGNHRLTAAKDRGSASIEARVIDLDKRKPRAFRSSAMLAIEPSAMQATFSSHDVEDVAEIVGTVAVLRIDGPLESKSSGWWGFDNYESILCRFRNAIESDEVASVLLKFDSPGGDAAGLNECVDAMRAAQRATGKRVIAYVDESCYSAAYALSCVASEVYLPAAGGVGSVGVRSGLVSLDEANKKAGVAIELFASGSHKLLGDPDLPITDDARAKVQGRVDDLAKLFWNLVADARKMPTKDVQKLQAACFYGDDAIKCGLADGVMSLNEVIDLMNGLDNSATHESGFGGTQRRNARPETNRMAGILALEKAVKDARMALATSKNSAEKVDAADKLEIAKARLSAAQTGTTSKVVKHKKVVTDTHDDGESSSSSSSSSMSSASGESAESAESAASAESAEEAHEGATAAAQLMSMTGKKTLREAMGVVAGALEGSKEFSRRIAKLEKKEKSEKVERLIAAGIASRQITPGNEAKVREAAAKQGPGYLKAFLETAPSAIVSEFEEPESDDETAAQKPSKDQLKIWKAQGLSDKEIESAAKLLDQRKKFNARITGAAKGN